MGIGACSESSNVAFPSRKARAAPSNPNSFVNNVQPGPIDTYLNPASGDWATPQKTAAALDRYGRVDEVAALVAFVVGSVILIYRRSKFDR
jgi:NAD(P)-dependent dehydrogenase (short-subunit alcohol dehydrogenase family)